MPRGSLRKYLIIGAGLSFAVLPFVVQSNYLLSILIIIGIYTLVVEGSAS